MLPAWHMITFNTKRGHCTIILKHKIETQIIQGK
jgi:hypothetical protein